MDSFTFHRLKAELATGFSWADADVRILLLDLDALPDPDPAGETLDGIDVDGIELETDNYSRQALAGKAIFRDDPAGLVRFLADSVAFANLGPTEDGPTVGGAILYVFETDDSDSWPAVALGDVLGEVTGSTFRVSFPGTGVFTLGDG